MASALLADVFSAATWSPTWELSKRDFAVAISFSTRSGVLGNASWSTGNDFAWLISKVAFSKSL